MSIVQYFPLNDKGRDFYVGDIHGYRTLFDELLRRGNFDPEKDRVFSVGDLVDRGPDSVGCLELLNEPWFHAVMGNHEEFLLLSHGIDPSGEEMSEGQRMQFAHNHAHPQNGGSWIVTDDGQLRFPLPAGLLEKVKALPQVIVVGKDTPERINVLHASLFRNHSDEEDVFANFSDEYIDNELPTSDKYILQGLRWDRTLIKARSERGYKFQEMAPHLSTTMVGHTPIAVPVQLMSHLYLDTGVMYSDGALTALVLHKNLNHEFIRVERAEHESGK